MPNISPNRDDVHDEVSDAEIAALGLVDVAHGLTARQLRAIRRAACAHYGRDVRREVRVSRFDVRETRHTLLVVHLRPRPSAAAILGALARVLADAPTEGTA